MHTLQLDLSARAIFLPPMVLLSVIMVVFIWRKSVGAAIFLSSESQALGWVATVLCALKEKNKQDTSHIFLPQKRANEIGNLTHFQ
jgi:hypothetical protein